MPHVRRPKRNRRHHFIKEWRDYREMTQQEVADACGVAHSTYGRIERGLTPYNQDFLEQCATAFNCEPGDLLERDPTLAPGWWPVWEMIRKQSPSQIKRIVAVLAALTSG